MDALHLRRKKYKWADHARNKKSLAPVFGRVLEEIQKKNGGRWTNEQIVNAARPVRSPIHAMFDWDDENAAELYRRQQAGSYARLLEVEIVGGGKKVTLPVGVSFGAHSGHIATEKVLSSESLRTLMVQQALKEATSWMDRYKHLSELASVFKQIQRLTKTKKKAA